ncbi:MAG: 2-C-methyl-D-erythritol 4-phosphate cytidylyltransferase [Bacteroidales bacterium]|nr:2-C-methyl-D-erythritol 4-phosphate cytidylyltransferase [Bacteroidales bacterium]
MNIAVMLAGGTGERMGAGRPKQFIEIGHKPLIVHCLDIYEQSPDIDAIEVVCHKDWMDYTWKLVKQWNITKVKWVCEGGDTCQCSTRNGIYNLEGKVKDEDILMFVMSSSPFVNDEIIKDSLRVCHEHGSAFACMSSKYNLAYTEDGASSCHINFKEHNKTINMPWTSTFEKFNRFFHKAFSEGIETQLHSYVPTLWVALGETLWFSLDTTKNLLHATYKEDKDIFEAVLRMENRI